MAIVLGIDGGGTKTTGVIARANGEVLAQASVGATNPNSVGLDKVHEEFGSLFKKLQEIDDKAYRQVKHIFAGIAGASHPETAKEIARILQSIFVKMQDNDTKITPHEEDVRVTVTHDAVSALYSGTLGKEGIVQIAGTGAVAFGMTKDGKEGRVGGWGHLFSDHGSGYSLGRDALEKVFLSYDGHPVDTMLTKKVLAHFDVKKEPDIIRAVYHQGEEKTKIAELSKIVFDAAELGDVVAKDIVAKNGEALGKTIHLLIDKLFSDKLQQHGKIIVVLVGGLFHRFDLLKEYIAKGLGAQEKTVVFNLPKIPPVGGSVVGALKAEQIEVEEDFVSTFKATLE